jgi:hypothetical protein
MTEKKTIDTDVEAVTEAEVEVVDQRKVTFSYTRKKNLGNYESEDIGIYSTDLVPKSTKNMQKWIDDKSESAFNNMKVQVWAALGLSFGFNDRGDPVLDVPKPAPAPAAPAPAAPAAPQTGGVPIPQPQAPAQGQRQDNPSVAQVGYYAVEPQFCKDCGNQGLESFWDNRTDIDAKITAGQKIGPDFKCKSCNGGNGKGKPLYRPGSYDYNQAVGGAPAAPAQMAPPGAEEDPY